MLCAWWGVYARLLRRFLRRIRRVMGSLVGESQTTFVWGR